MEKLTAENFIELAIKAHGSRYDYSNVIYKKADSKVTIICKVHGEFQQKPSIHIHSHGCKLCVFDALKMTTEQFVEKARNVHGDKFDYSLVDYKKHDLKVKIVCPIHGVFEQRASTHLEGSGCFNCGNLERTLTKEQFIERANKTHNFKYDYSLVEYVNSHTKIKIICPEHGVFLQSPNNHIRHRNCPQCKIVSNGEKVIANLLGNLHITFEREKTFPTCVHETRLRFDFYLPEQNVLIEFDGRQHHQQSFFDPLELIQLRDNIKNEWAKDNNIPLFRFNNLKTLEQDLMTMLSSYGLVEPTFNNNSCRFY